MLTALANSLKLFFAAVFSRLFSYFPSLQYSSSSPPTALADETQKFAFPLVEKIHVNYNTRRLRFRLPSDKHILGIAPGQHVCLSANINGKLIVRSYTPVSNCEDLGYVEIIVKIYFRGVHPSFPDGGKMSQHLDGLEIGQTVDFRGPTGSILHRQPGIFFFKKLNLERRYNQLSMIAGGSGLTPMLQIISTVLRNPADTTCIKFIFANTEEKDILCREELDELVAKSNERLVVRLLLTQPTAEWKEGRGRVNLEEIQNGLFPPSDQNLVMLCGPTGLVNQACKPSLEKLGYSSDHIYVF